MALNSSDNGKSKSFNLIAGPVVGTKIIVNPTLKELNDYGVTWFKTDPKYDGNDQSGNKQFIIDIWFKIEPFTYKEKSVENDKEIRNIRLYLQPITRKSQSGNLQFVNKFGKFVYAANLEAIPEWFDNTGIREALDGEEVLYEFLRNYGNFKNIDELQLTRELLVEGDFSELIAFVKNSPDRKFKCILGLSYNTDKAQYKSIVYTKKFWRNWQETISFKDGSGGWLDESFAVGVPKLLTEEYMNFPKSVFTPGEAMILTKAEVDTRASLPDISGNINSSEPKENEETNDLPF